MIRNGLVLGGVEIWGMFLGGKHFLSWSSNVMNNVAVQSKTLPPKKVFAIQVYIKCICKRLSTLKVT